MEIERVVIHDICKFIGGSQPPKKVFSTVPKHGYIRLIQTRDYKTDSFITYIPINKARRFCDITDIMIGRYGPPIFQICRGLKGAYNVALMKAVPKSNISNDYLYYFLKQDAILKYVERLSLRTGGQTGVDLECLNQYPVLLPDLVYQKKVENVLKSLDAKIELNNRINALLEAMAKTLYDYWFVQFDFPNKKGKPYKSSGGKMIYDKKLKREIPEGWEVKDLSDIADITMGQSPAGDSYNDSGDGVMFFQGSTDFGWRFPTVRQYTTQPSRMAKKGDILLSVRAPVGTLNMADNECCIGRGLAALRSKDGFNSYLFYEMLYFKKIFDLRDNTGTTFGSITKDDLFSLKLVHPKNEYLSKYDSIVSKYNNIILNNHKQNQQLDELRNWLLPMLMNGQVRVKQK